MQFMYFSPRGTTKKIARTIAQAWASGEERDMLTDPLTQTVVVPPTQPLLVALPVYAGRIPPLCAQQLGHLKGSGGPAVAVVAYGNRAYDDALLELADLLTERGFQVVAAGAFIGRHSIFTSVAEGRPDGADQALLAQFGARCRAAAEAPAAEGVLTLPGDPAYRDTPARRVPMCPTGNRNCIKCRVCAKRCPTGAIPLEEPTRTQADRCMACGLCIHICPTQARGYFQQGFSDAEAAFAQKNAAYRTPETFFL